MRCYGADKNVALQIKIWDLYIRVGPGSRKLTSRETLTYMNNRKNKTPDRDNSFSESNGATS